MPNRRYAAVIQKLMIEEYTPEELAAEMHITTDNLIDTLKNMNVTNVHDVEYMALYTGSKTLTALEKLTGLGLDFKHYRPKDLVRKIKKILQ